MKKATFAAGCFWGIQAIFDKLPGVHSTQVGYTGGHTPSPSYQQVCHGDTGHAEAVEIEYDPQEINYQQLLDIFWQCHNPTLYHRQGPDIGSQYRSAIFYHDDEQQQLALSNKEAQQKNLTDPIVTEIVSATQFYRAEEYHQHYFKKQGRDYCPTFDLKKE